MKWWNKIFVKIVFILLLLLIPITVFYSYSYYTSIQVIKEELKDRNLNRLSIVGNQMDANFEQISILLLALSGDENVNQFKNIDIYSDYKAFEIKRSILETLYFQRALSSWTNDLSVYASDSEELLKTSDMMEKSEDIVSDWEYRENKEKGKINSYFIKHLTQPITSVSNGRTPELVIEARLPVKNIERFLQQLKLDNFGDPFMYQSVNKVIVSSSANHQLITEMIQQIPENLPSEDGNITVTIDKDKYLVSYMKSQKLDWVIVDYTPLKEVLMPVTKNRNLFYTFIFALLLLSIVAVFLLYRNVQIPFRDMINAIHRVKEGDYSARVQPVHNNEFTFMMTSFNEMAKQIETLIEEVYKEKIRYQEIHVKQLQSQINPHFLYNCLFIMKNMAKLNQYKGVEAMSLHLGKYYRYMTRVENKYSTVDEELDFVKNYLEIHVIRTQRLTYEIKLPDNMLEIVIPRLLIQPVVENACVHGIDSSLNDGRILISGSQANGENQIIIEDSGKGLSKEKIKQLGEMISVPMNDEMGCGVWNVHHRLKYHFGDTAGLHFSKSELGGLKVILYWRETTKDV
ncbi:sensor histidine kinase [Lederbergia lenta]|uniref:Two-component sensor histidine kinase n=1 Tax=Lederbergia lenta TaxID=1467 RepID=A0A2X4ZSG8_LEDLE|nr:histidine kinase [Lederbergia lenta]MEC2323345.1 histidine kinase [Lederbergia lenta]SQI63254.1 two-component sensor histidine kinase [Lederbergia lenta]